MLLTPLSQPTTHSSHIFDSPPIRLMSLPIPQLSRILISKLMSGLLQFLWYLVMLKICSTRRPYCSLRRPSPSSPHTQKNHRQEKRYSNDSTDDYPSDCSARKSSTATAS